MSNNWEIAARIWRGLESPLVPSAEEIAWQTGFLSDDRKPLSSGALRVAILGVTPQLVHAPWPADVDLHAVDLDQAMIGALWDDAAAAVGTVHEANWSAMPFDDQSIDHIVGDCSLSATGSYDNWPAILTSLHRVLKPEAGLGLRFFVAPDGAPDIEELVAQAMAGAYPRSVEFNLAFAVACRRDGQTYLPDALAAFNRLVPNRANFAEAAGWTLERVNRADMVLGQKQTILYPNERMIRDYLEPWFEPVSRHEAGFRMACYCPTYLFRKRT
jgi:hypothetical protein